jgi:hypothetical protein
VRAQLTLRAEEVPRDVERLAPDNNDLLAIQQLFGHDAGKATEKVAFAINNDLESVSPYVHSTHATDFGVKIKSWDDVQQARRTTSRWLAESSEMRWRWWM